MLIAARNAMVTGGKRLPYDAEVEFLESTGTQYIDTGIRGAGSGYLAATFQPLNVGSSSTYWRYFGASNGATKTDRTIAYNANGRTNFENGYNLVVLGTSRGDIYTIQKTGYNVPSGSTIGDNNFQIFGYNGTTNLGNVRFYSFSLWDSNDTLVRDLIPVRKGTVGYLYDRVSGKLFGNAGTGDFVLGPDVVPVEWLEGGQLNGGIAFIDTGYSPNSSTKIESTSAILSASGYSGRYGNQSRFTFGAYSGRLYLAQGGHYYLGGCTVGTFYSFVNDIPNRTVSVEGVGSTSTAAVSDWHPQSYPVYLFASNVSPTGGTNVNGKILDTNSLGQIRMKSCGIWENNTPVHKFLPVRVSTEGAMMDVLTRRIYRNAGTGAFTYGDDLKYPIPAA